MLQAEREDVGAGVTELNLNHLVTNNVVTYNGGLILPNFGDFGAV